MSDKERHAITDTIWDTLPSNPIYWEDVVRAGDKLYAIGYRKPRTITTHEELDALPVWSVVMSENIAHQKYDETDGYDWAADGRFYNASQIDLPATVLHEGATS